MSMPEKIWVGERLMGDGQIIRYWMPIGCQVDHLSPVPDIYAHSDLVAEKDAEIERLRDELNRYAGREALSLMREQHARIAFLKKALEQACAIGGIKLNGAWLDDRGGCMRLVYAEKRFAELVAYLRERDSRPPSGGVQSGVQGEQGNEETA